MGHAHDGHAHAHGHGHVHGHAGPGDRWASFFVGVVPNLLIVAVEVYYGIAARSMALLADAGHNLGDVLGLLLAGSAALLARRRPTKRHTYGYRKITLLSALANGVFLLVATGAIAWESVRRLIVPEAPAARIVIAVAALGAVVNGVTALLFLRDRDRDLNVRAAFLHLVGDAGISLGVVASAVVVLLTGWARIDPIVSLLVGGLILVNTWSLLRGSVTLVLDAVPEGIDIDEVREYLASLPRVREVHDLHIWAMSTTETALTAHLVMPAHASEPTFLASICRELHDRFDIDHGTLQVDPEEAPDPCRLSGDMGHA